MLFLLSPASRSGWTITVPSYQTGPACVDPPIATTVTTPTNTPVRWSPRSQLQVFRKTDGSRYGQHGAGNDGGKRAFRDIQRGGFVNDYEWAGTLIEANSQMVEGDFRADANTDRVINRKQ